MPFAVYILGFLIFSQTTSEFMVAGIMPSLSEEFGVSTSAIGYLISVYAAGMIIGGSLLIIGLRNMPQKKALLVITSIFLAGQVLGSIAPNYGVMIVARAITGVSSAACFGISMAITFHLVGAQARSRAASIVLGGLMVATTVGLPLAMVFNQYFGWRSSFWAIVLLVLLAGLLAQWFIPSTIKQEQVSIRKELELFMSYPLWAAYTTSMFIKLAFITIPVIMMIGLSGVSLNPAMATRVTRAGGTGTLVATVHTSIINLGIVLGSFTGGLTIDAGYGLASPLWVGALLAMIGLISLLPVFL